ELRKSSAQRQQQTAATALPTDDSHYPPSALRPAQMTSIDLPAAIWHGGGQRFESLSSTEKYQVRPHQGRSIESRRPDVGARWEPGYRLSHGWGWSPYECPGGTVIR